MKWDNFKIDDTSDGFKEPAVDISSDKDWLIIVLDIPGIDKKDLQINLIDDLLEVKAEKKREKKEERENYFKIERAFVGFYRRIPLPEEVISEKAKADYIDGVLTIRVPKKVPSSKKFKVKVG